MWCLQMLKGLCGFLNVEAADPPDLSTLTKLCDPSQLEARESMVHLMILLGDAAELHTSQGALDFAALLRYRQLECIAQYRCRAL